MVCKMMKKGLVGVGLGALGLGLLFGTSAPSYVRTAFHNVRHSAKDAVPVQFEIDRARNEIAALDPAIHDNIEALANSEVDVKHLEREIVAFRENLDRQAKQMLALNEGLKSGRFQLASGVSYSAAEVKADLVRRLDQYRRNKEILGDKEETLKIRQQNVLAARATLAEMIAQKRALSTKVEGIEARHKQIEATRSTNEFTFDDSGSALARVKQTVSELDRRLDVMAQVADQEGRLAEKEIPLPVEACRDVVKEIDAEFAAPGHSADKSL